MENRLFISPHPYEQSCTNKAYQSPKGLILSPLAGRLFPSQDYRHLDMPPARFLPGPGHFRANCLPTRHLRMAGQPAGMGEADDVGHSRLQQASGLPAAWRKA